MMMMMMVGLLVSLIVAKMARHMKGNVYKPESDNKIVLSRGLILEYVD